MSDRTLSIPALALIQSCVCLYLSIITKRIDPEVDTSAVHHGRYPHGLEGIFERGPTKRILLNGIHKDNRLSPSTTQLTWLIVAVALPLLYKWRL